MSTAPITTDSSEKLSRKDFVSDQEVRWCPGCGDYSILAQVQKSMPDLGVPRENLVFISGIGCSSRFPYYMNTYGFHSIHGRAMTLATGLKSWNPDLSVWVITGDGDGLSIGGNHFLHTLRRNVDINVIMFNNRIYGLTKGQYSPTSEMGKKTKSSPLGSIDHPINPVRAAIAAEATWVARSMDVDTKHLPQMIEAMAKHKGISFLEVFQNCNIFNDGAFKHFTEKTQRLDRILYLENGAPIRFGKEHEKGLILDGLGFKIAEVAEVGEDALVRYDSSDPNMAYLMANLDFPDYPVPVGVLLDIQRDTYDELLQGQMEFAKAAAGGKTDLQALLTGPNTWTVA